MVLPYDDYTDFPPLINRSSLNVIEYNMSFPSEVDVIIVGGGAAGLIIASRLAKASPTTSFAIVEAGQNNLDMPTVVQPAMYLS